MPPDFDDLLERLDAQLAAEVEEAMRESLRYRDYASYGTDFGTPDPTICYVYVDPTSGRKGQHSARLPFDVEGTAVEDVRELEP